MVTQTAMQANLLHRVYIQSLLARRAMREDLALEMYRRAISVVQKGDRDFRPLHRPNTKGLLDFLNDLSTLLEEVGMEVKVGKEETGAGKGWVVLVNTDPSEISHLATDYNPLEITYFRLIITEIMLCYPINSIGANRALALTNRLESTMTRSTAEMLLKSFVSRQWLLLSKRGRYSLAPRTLMELETLLKEEFDDYIYTCQRCSKIVLTGVACSKEGCDCHMHESCYTAYITHRNQCPSCQISFTDQPAKFLGEKAASRESDGLRRANGGGRAGKRKSGGGGRRNVDGEEEDEDEDENGARRGSLESEEEDLAQVGESSARSRNGADSEGPSQSQPKRPRRSGPGQTQIPETQLEESTQSQGAAEEDEEEDSQPVRRRR